MTTDKPCHYCNSIEERVPFLKLKKDTEELEDIVTVCEKCYNSNRKSYWPWSFRDAMNNWINKPKPKQTEEDKYWINWDK